MEPVTRVVVTVAAFTVPTSYSLEETFALLGVGMRVLVTVAANLAWYSCPLEKTFALLGAGMRVLDTAGCVDSA